ncbi:MAG: hypothetical protein CMP49_04835 [Flavobacteriales bacterium]|nr:hypothetical protein [Flavobacteriales bacterium]
MKKIILSITIFLNYFCWAQPNTYYESCIGLTGEELRLELHNIIKDHTSFSYTTTKTILREADEDPNNDNNIILVYSGNSIDKYDFASTVGSEVNDFWNREHVWPKSHGDFDAGDPFEVPLFTDAHNLKPVDYSMNNLIGDKDFDNGGDIVYNGINETTCLSTSSTFEPRDEVKGDIARIILYMDIRYEGGDNEPNLVIMDDLTTYPYPQIGVLSTLLEWHSMDPPDAFEKRRNDIIFEWQGNRNPFIDYPEFVDFIYNNQSNTNSIEFTQVILPETINGEEEFNITAYISSQTNCGSIESVEINYGNSWYNLNNTITMNYENNWYAIIPEQDYNSMFCYTITAIDCTGNSNVFYGSSIIPPFPFEGVITPIIDIQGQTEFSPYEGQTVNTTGIVTGAFANSFYIQDGAEPWSGIYIYSSGALPAMGDSVIVSGEISEFCWNGSPCDCSSCGGAGVTEFYQPENIYIISNDNPLPEPIVVSSGEALSEEYEGVLIYMEDVECTALPGGFGVWQVNDGSGNCGIHNTPDGFEFNPQIGEIYNITGIVTSTFNEWKVDLRIPSDVETGADTAAPFVMTHACYQVDNNYYVYLYFNEEINEEYLTINNFLITNATIQNITSDIFDPTKITLTLSDILDPTMGLIIYEMADLNGNVGSNLTYSIDCNNEFWTEDINEYKYNFSIYPNPNNGFFNIDIYETENTLYIYNVNGVKVNSIELSMGTHTLHLNNPGFYYLTTDKYRYMPLIIEN